MLKVLVHALPGLLVFGLSLPQVLVALGGGMVQPVSVAGTSFPMAIAQIW